MREGRPLLGGQQAGWRLFVPGGAEPVPFGPDLGAVLAGRELAEELPEGTPVPEVGQRPGPVRLPAQDVRWAMGMEVEQHNVLVVAADTDPAAEQQAGRLAALAGLARAGQGQVAAARSKPDRVSRVTQARPLPAHQPPGPQLPPPAPIPALPAETGALVSMEHGIPHGEVVAGSLSVDLGDRVVANDLPIERAYIIGPRYQPGPADAAGDGMTGGRRPHLALPGGRFFRARILGHHPPRDQIGPDQILVRVSIPAGAAILPNATRAALAGDDGTPQDQEVWLPPNTLARIRLTRAYATWGPVVTGMAASGAPGRHHRRGSPGRARPRSPRRPGPGPMPRSRSTSWPAARRSTPAGGSAAPPMPTRRASTCTGSPASRTRRCCSSPSMTSTSRC